MIEHEYGTLFGNDSIDKQIVITTDDKLVTITNNELHNEAFELKESISSDTNLVYGTAVASVLKFTVSNVFTNLKNQVLNVSVYLNHDNSKSLKLGRFKVYSDIPTADRKKREIVAYDALYDVLRADVTAWYNSVLPNNTSTTTLKAFRDSFFAHFGITQEEITLVNDNMVVKKTIQPEELSGKVVLNAICEINACFGHINRNGNFKYIYLTPIAGGLYPSESLQPSETLYPSEPNTYQLNKDMYISATYEDFVTEKVNKLQIKQEENDIGVVVGNGNNSYVIQDNFLIYGKSSTELQSIAEKIYNVIKEIYYKPFNATARGNFCLEVGDSITLVTKYHGVMSYVLERTIKGIQALRDDLSADGEQYQPTKVNSTNRSIQQLSGKYNKLTRTVDETRIEMGDMEKDLYSTISATSKELTTSFNNTASGLQSQITQNANQISLRVTSSDFNSAISVLNNKIDLKVSSGEVQSMIDVSLKEIKITSSQISLEGYTTINGNFSIDANGDCNIKGHVEATSGKIGGFSITPTVSGGWLEHGDTILSEHTCYFGAVYTNDINGYEPITEGNIWSYIPSTSGFATESWVESNFSSATDFSDLNSTVSVHSGYISSFATSIGSLSARVAALEAAIQ